VDGGGDEEDAAACAGWAGGRTVGGVGGGGVEEVREHGFDGVVGAEDVDVEYRFEGVGGEVGDGREEVAGCSGSGGGCWLGLVVLWEVFLHAEIDSAELLDTALHCFNQTFWVSHID
jgi:hypothetical protein